MIRTCVAPVAALLAFATAASAETAFELAFRNGTLDAFEAGDRLDYESVVTMPAGGEADDKTVSVALEDGGVATLQERTEEAARALGQFNAGVGNPLCMYFLERTIRSVAEETGGSPFYLRNRIKDALHDPLEVREVEVDWLGRTVAGTEIVLAPFANDPNVDRLGDFADLRISLVVGEDIPGWYRHLSAEAGEGAYASVLSLAEVVE